MPVAAAAIGVAIILAFLIYSRIGEPVHAAATPESAPLGNSVAVLPFLDLTSESMDQEFSRMA